MKTKNLIWWVLALASLDVLIKVIIDAYFLDTRFTIIPGLFEFKPTFNNIAPYFLQLLGQQVDHISHITLVCVIALAACYIYKRALKKASNPKWLNIAFALIFAAILSSLTAQLIYKGILDYIYLKPLFVFDLKDIYVNCGTIIFLFYIYNRDKNIETTSS
ncbi:signal peptidase II [Bacteroides sp. 51]|uniref:signal peptidase II n=1 Tax=Bacteroides sp. 51 TaxID=2302938 RepID=UPI0013D52115|nr:signal peptidase II [Bacteroides sp. 51]NDV82277.1 signal peptidase II [Bacteroides sp. 51]